MNPSVSAHSYRARVPRERRGLRPIRTGRPFRCNRIESIHADQPPARSVVNREIQLPNIHRLTVVPRLSLLVLFVRVSGLLHHDAGRGCRRDLSRHCIEFDAIPLLNPLRVARNLWRPGGRLRTGPRRTRRHIGGRSTRPRPELTDQSRHLAGRGLRGRRRRGWARDLSASDPPLMRCCYPNRRSPTCR